MIFTRRSPGNVSKGAHNRQNLPKYEYMCSNENSPVFTARRVCIARTMPWQDVLSVRPSVCLLHAGILSKRAHISSSSFHHRVAPPL